MSDENTIPVPPAESGPDDGDGIIGDLEHDAPTCPRCGCLLLFPCENRPRVPTVGDTVVLHTMRGNLAGVIIGTGDGQTRPLMVVDIATMPTASVPPTSATDLANGDLRPGTVGIARSAPHGFDAGEWAWPWEEPREEDDDEGA